MRQNKPKPLFSLTLLFTLAVLFFAQANLPVAQTEPALPAPAAPATPKDALKYNLNECGSQYFQVTFLNQTWLRYNQSNPGTTVQGEPQNETFDIGLRRTRIQLFGQVTERAFVYFQFGQNNFNAMYNSAGGNVKSRPFSMMRWVSFA